MAKNPPLLATISATKTSFVWAGKNGKHFHNSFPKFGVSTWFDLTDLNCAAALQFDGMGKEPIFAHRKTNLIRYTKNGISCEEKEKDGV